MIQEFLTALCGFYGIIYFAFFLYAFIFGTKTALFIMTKKKMACITPGTLEDKAYSSYT